MRAIYLASGSAFIAPRFSTPGMVMSAVDLLAHNPRASEAEIREQLEGNICRCTGYQNIVHAVQTAQKAMAA